MLKNTFRMRAVISWVLYYLDSICKLSEKIGAEIIKEVKKYDGSDDTGTITVNGKILSLEEASSILNAIRNCRGFLQEMNRLHFITKEKLDEVKKIVQEAEKLITAMKGLGSIERPKLIEIWMENGLSVI